MIFILFICFISVAEDYNIKWKSWQFTSKFNFVNSIDFKTPTESCVISAVAVLSQLSTILSLQKNSLNWCIASLEAQNVFFNFNNILITYWVFTKMLKHICPPLISFYFALISFRNRLSMYFVTQAITSTICESEDGVNFLLL